MESYIARQQQSAWYRTRLGWVGTGAWDAEQRRVRMMKFSCGVCFFFPPHGHGGDCCAYRGGGADGGGAVAAVLVQDYAATGI